MTLQPEDTFDLTKFISHDKHTKNNKSVLSFQLRESVKRLSDTQERLEYIHSLQDTICMNYREMTEQEVTLEEKVCRHKTIKLKMMT